MIGEQQDWSASLCGGRHSCLSRPLPEDSRFSLGNFPGSVIAVTYNLLLQWQLCQAPGDMGSAWGLVGPVSVYCDWVR